MSIDLEYAIKKDIRNNPVVREVDQDQRREFLRTAGKGALVVFMLLFSCWQYASVRQGAYDVSKLRTRLTAAEAANRRLHLKVEQLRSPQVIEERAIRDLHMIAPTAADTITIEVAPAAVPSKTIVAEVR